MNRTNYVDNIEFLFLNKLQEKYQLNERDIKKAFGKFDKDNNGLLDLNEIKIVVSLMLNGVNDEQIRLLVTSFDLNGDGKISYEEFLSYLRKLREALDRSKTTKNLKQNFTRNGSNNSNNRTTSSSDYNENQHSNFDHLSSPSYVASQEKRFIEDLDLPDDTYSRNYNDGFEYKDDSGLETRFMDVPGNPSSRNNNDPQLGQRELEYRCKEYLECLKAYITKQAYRMRSDATIPHNKSITMSTSDLTYLTAKSILAKAFQHYTGIGSGRARDEGSLVDVSNQLK